MKTNLTTLILFLTLNALGQPEGINQLDSAGKKHGEWLLYLDYNWKVVKDSSKAVYARFVYFDHGENTGTFGQRGFNGWTYEPTNDTAGKNEIILPDGEYKSYDKKGRLRIEQTFNNGRPLHYRSYRKTGEVQLVMDFTKKWKDQPHTYALYQHKKGGDVWMYFVHKGPKYWAAYEAIGDSTSSEVIKTIGDSTFATLNFYVAGHLIRSQDRIYIQPPERSEPLHNTILHGKSTSWYYNGQKAAECQFYYGEQTGEWKYYKVDGKPFKPSQKRKRLMYHLVY